MRTTLSIDDDVYETVNSIAKSSQKRLGEVVSQLLKKQLYPAPISPQETDDDFDFVTFPTKQGVKRETITSEAVQQAIYSEGEEDYLPGGRYSSESLPEQAISSDSE